MQPRPCGTVPHGEPASGFASLPLHVGASGCWDVLRWDWIYQSAHRAAARLGRREPTDDLAHDIALDTVVTLSARPRRPGARGPLPRPAANEIRIAINAAESRVTQRYERSGATRGGNVPTTFPGARVSPGQWRALYAWLRRAVPNERARGILELTLRGESLARAAELAGVTPRQAAVLRSLALAACRRALGQTV